VAGFGIAVTVSPVWSPPAEWGESLPAGVTRRATRLTEILDPGELDGAGVAAELTAVACARAKIAAYEAGLVARLAALRSDRGDRKEQPGAAVAGWLPEPPPVGVSEFLPDELAMITRSSRAGAVGLAERSLVLVHELPETWGALADGRIDEPRARAIAAALGGQSVNAGGPVDPAVVAEVESRALEWALAGETPVRLKERTAAALIAADQAAADRRRKKAERHADVTVRRGADGMAELVADLPAPVAAACREAVDCYARLAKETGDGRPIGQLRALALADLILRPWDTSREPVTAHLTITAELPTLAAGAGSREASGEAAAAEVDGAPITAGQLRELLEQLDALCPGGLQAPAGGSLALALTDPHTGVLRAVVTRAELDRLARRGCPTHPAGDCGCAVLHRPPRVDRYQPTPGQRRFVRGRDRTCRHPGCRRPAARTDVDHVDPHGRCGATDCVNLCCLCRRHHRLKTHARGWRFAMSHDGVLTVTTPSGVTRTTRPPGLRLLAHGLRPAAAGTDDDPPPF
jgi:hypothetical protein